MHERRVVVDGLAFGEGPRWHHDELWFSDMHAGRVMATSDAGASRVVCEIPHQPSGLGWDTAGRLLVVSMTDRRLLRVNDDGLVDVVADLSELAPWHCNDMVVAANGRAYIGNFGFDLDGGADPVLTNLIMVTPDGSTTVVADQLGFPNGMVITPDQSTLIVGESFKARLTAFDIAADGSLSNRRVWAKLDGAVPDGICLDADGAIWSACPLSNRVLRVAEGGAVLDEIPTGRGAFACMLGGVERITLYVCTAETSHPSETVARRTGRIEAVQVEVAGAGLP